MVFDANDLACPHCAKRGNTAIRGDRGNTGFGEMQENNIHTCKNCTQQFQSLRKYHVSQWFSDIIIPYDVIYTETPTQVQKCYRDHSIQTMNMMQFCFYGMCGAALYMLLK